MIVAGLMSGTSADGIDAAVVRIEGVPPALTWHVLGHLTVPHTDELRARIFACCDPATSNVEQVCALNFALGPVKRIPGRSGFCHPSPRFEKGGSA